MALSTERKIQGGFVFALVLLSVVGAMSYRSVGQLREDAAWVDHTHRVIASLELLLSTITDLETAEGGYIMTGEDSFLAPHSKAMRDLERELESLQRLTWEQALQRERWQDLLPLVVQRMALSRGIVEARRSQGFTAAQAAIATGKGKQIQERIRALVVEIEQTEKRLLREREVRAQENSALARTVIIGGSALAFALVAIALFIIGRDFAAIRRAEGALRDSRDQLETRVWERTAELTQTNEMLRASEARLRTVTETAQVGLAIVDEEYRYRYANRLYTDILRLPTDAIVGQHVADVLAPVYAEHIRPHLERAFAGEQVSYELEFPSMAPGRQQRWYSVSHEPGIADFGNVVIVVVVDITERKRAAEMQERLAAIVESSDDAIIGNTVDGLITAWNLGAEKLFGHSSQEALGKSIQMLIPPQRLSEEWNLIRQIAQGESVDPFETIRVRKDGTCVDVSVNMSPVRDTTGRIVGVSTVARDMTERRRVEEEIRKWNIDLEQRVTERTAELHEAKERAELSDRAKSEFLANISHELRTPLNGIIGFSELLADEKVGALNPQQREFMNDILTSGRHLLDLINDVLDLTTVATGKLDFKPEKFSISEAIRETCAIVKPMAADKNIAVSVEAPHDDRLATLDPIRFKQVLYNLLSNAVKFTPDDGAITVTAVIDEHNQIRLKVKDTGIGIKQDDLSRIFRQFVQLDSGFGKRQQGTGLGLALTKRIVEIQKGSITAESEIGKGSTFTVVLPIDAS
jgi:PAS domain S-box-containing protein